MLVLLFVLLFLLAISIFLIVPMIFGWEVYSLYRGTRAVTCPETHRQVGVSFDAVHAVVTGLTQAEPEVRLADCTRWPERARCGQECLPEALKAEAYTEGEVAPSKQKKIYHLPVFMAAFAAWVLGAIWHSQFAFRWQWAHALGLGRPEVRDILEWWSPHLLSAGALLLFAYGVAWLLAVSRLRGAVWGAAKAIALWVVIAAAGVFAAMVTGLPAEFLKIELAYTLLASALIGAIIGGLSGKLVVARFEERPSH